MMTKQANCRIAMLVEIINAGKQRPDAHRREQKVIADEAMLDSPPIEVRMVAIVGQNELAKTLARVGRLIDDGARSPSGQHTDATLYNEGLRSASPRQNGKNS
jgi:hypothetical protein